MLVGPRIEVKAIEGDALSTDRYSRDQGAHFAVEAVLVHAEIPRRIAQSQQSGRENQARRCTRIRSDPGAVLDRRLDRPFLDLRRRVLTHRP
jgi:hypothetical protein